MREIIPIQITGENFAAYGSCYDLRDSAVAVEQGKQEFMSRMKIRDEPLKVGVTAVKGGPFFSRSMERHMLGEEVLMCGEDDMVLTVADSDPTGAPGSQDVKAFVVSPGQVVVLNKGIWHDANHGIHKDTSYFFLIPPREFVASEVMWTDILPEPVHVTWELRGSEKIQVKPVSTLAFSRFGTYTKVIDGEGMSGETGWTSWLEPWAGLATGAHIGIHFPEETCYFHEMECDEEGERQILCAGNPLIIAVMEKEEKNIEAFTLKAGEYVVLKKGICFKVLKCMSLGGYYYTFTQHGQKIATINLNGREIECI